MTHVRHLVLGLTAITLLVVLAITRGAKPVPEASAGDGVVTVKVFNETGELVGPVIVQPVRKTDDEWRRTLTPEQYRVVRQKGTERAFTGALVGNHDDGVYTCVACGLPLFDSKSKFESRTGWPSFFRPIAPGNVAEQEDRSLGMVRTEVTCPRCDAHLGHVFDDGPPPTGRRYCLNSVSLAFTPSGDLPTLADPVLKQPQPATAVLAGGCFWCVEAVFEQFDGVLDVQSGYAGGTRADASYEIVSSGRTNNAESVRIVYDPAKITYADLLRIHLTTHDPTQLDRQGHDVGHQYRSAIFYADPQQRATGEAVIAEFNEKGVWPDPIVTTLEPLTEFYPAEAYHQDYVRLHPDDGYVRAVSLPKVANARTLFEDRLKPAAPATPAVDDPTSRPE